MTTADKPIDVERVACEICLREVPVSEATVPEATDYIVYFCGLDCYERWKRQSRQPAESVKASGKRSSPARTTQDARKKHIAR
jgi:hypothetical protein